MLTRIVPGELTSEEPLTVRLDRALAEPPTLERDLRVAVLCALLARREESIAALRWDRADPRAIAPAAALVALAAGDPMRARVAAERVPDDPFARALAAEACTASGDFADARAHLAAIDTEDAYAKLVFAVLELREGDARAAYARLMDASARGLLGARIRRTRAEAWLATGPEDVRPARDDLSAAVWQLARIGAPDELGRCYLSMAEVEAAARGAPREGSAAAWLARAHPLLDRAGTPQDQERLRRAFRRFGRRAIDRLVGGDLERLIESVRSERSRGLDLVSAASDARAHGQDAAALDLELARVIAALGGHQDELIASLEGAIVDKERTDRLVAVCRAIFVLETEDELDRELPRLALELGGEAASLHHVSTAGLVTVTRAGATAGSVSAEVVSRAIDRGAVETAEIDGRKATVVPIGASGPVDRLIVIWRGDSRVGPPRDDAARLEILGSVAGAAYERARHALAVREAAARDAATLEAIHEGIVTLDERGNVRSINGAAAALLRISRGDAEGRKLADLPGLRALADAIARAVEDETVALQHVDVLVRARAYSGGVVATLQELGRARALAHKLVGSAARFTFEDLIGADSGLRDTILDARRVAAADVPILITGESGTGKELLAQAIHNASPRAAHPFVGVNVAAIPRELLESELFGYEAGAFTGARTRGHPGRFELADRGTLLLDEIGDMPFEMQAKLLRVLQERIVVRLGGTRGIPVLARLIATTHRDLDQAVKDGSFRLDLFYRLRVVHLRLPSLRERKADVRPLIEHQLALHAQRTGRKVRLTPKVMGALERYDWPGNVRELANLIEGMVSLLGPDEDQIAELPPHFGRAQRARPSDEEIAGALGDVERRAVEHALAASDGNIAQAARALGIARGTLYNKMARYGLR